jgi:hypothetical protein
VTITTLQSEAQLHAAVSDYLDVALPKTAWFTTFPLGGGGAIRGAQLKRRGTKAGTPDVLIVYRGTPYFIELKRMKGGVVSEKQSECHVDLMAAGARVAICKSVEEVASVLRTWMPLRAMP